MQPHARRSGPAVEGERHRPGSRVGPVEYVAHHRHLGLGAGTAEGLVLHDLLAEDDASGGGRVAGGPAGGDELVAGGDQVVHRFGGAGPRRVLVLVAGCVVVAACALRVGHHPRHPASAVSASSLRTPGRQPGRRTDRREHRPDRGPSHSADPRARRTGRGASRNPGRTTRRNLSTSAGEPHSAASATRPEPVPLQSGWNDRISSSVSNMSRIPPMVDSTCPSPGDGSTMGQPSLR